jgi:hypothetical protein
MVVATTGEEEEEEEGQQQQQDQDNKKKKKPRIFGLAGAPPEVRKRVATLGGMTRAADKASLSKAGQRGGLVVKESYGLEYYSRLGRKGGQTVVERLTITHFEDMGRKSGIAKRKMMKKKKQKS